MGPRKNIIPPIIFVSGFCSPEPGSTQSDKSFRRMAINALVQQLYEEEKQIPWKYEREKERESGREGEGGREGERETASWWKRSRTEKELQL